MFSMKKKWLKKKRVHKERKIETKKERKNVFVKFTTYERHDRRYYVSLP